MDSVPSISIVLTSPPKKCKRLNLGHLFGKKQVILNMYKQILSGASGMTFSAGVSKIVKAMGVVKSTMYDRMKVYETRTINSLRIMQCGGLLPTSMKESRILRDNSVSF